MAKKVIAKIRLHIEAGKATPAPPIGPALAQHGVNMGEFTSAFNDKTKEMSGFKIPTDILVFEDRSFDMILHQPPASALIKKALGIEKGSGQPNKAKIAKKLTKGQLQQIAEQKKEDLNTDDTEQAMKVIAGTAKSMGVDVE